MNPAAGVRRGERGFALLIVLWTLALASLVATQVTVSGRTELRLVTALRDAATLEAAADGAVHEALFRLLDPSVAAWRADGATRRLPLAGGGAVLVRVVDQGGKVNPNSASPELLAALLRGVGADARRAQSLAAAMADWRFPNAQARPGGARAPEYRAAGLSYGPPGAPFRSLGEIGAVLGMTPELLERLAPYLSLDVDGDPNPGLASPVVLEAIRAATGARDLAAVAPTGPRIVSVRAEALRSNGTRFERAVVARVGGNAGNRPFQILRWELGSDSPADPPPAGAAGTGDG